MEHQQHRIDKLYESRQSFESDLTEEIVTLHADWMDARALIGEGHRLYVIIGFDWILIIYLMRIT